MEKSRKGQGKVKERSSKGSGKVKERSRPDERQGQGKINVRLKQSIHSHNYNL